MTAIQKVKQVGSNLAKPDHKIGKWIGNIAIYGILPAAWIVSFFVPEPYHTTLREIVPIITTAIKGLTKFTTEKPF